MRAWSGAGLVLFGPVASTATEKWKSQSSNSSTHRSTFKEWLQHQFANDLRIFAALSVKTDVPGAPTALRTGCEPRITRSRYAT